MEHGCTQLGLITAASPVFFCAGGRALPDDVFLDEELVFGFSPAAALAAPSSGRFASPVVDTGKAMKSYDMVSDLTDTTGGGTLIQAYLRSNQDAATKAAPEGGGAAEKTARNLHPKYGSRGASMRGRS